MFLLIDNKIYCFYSLILSKSTLIFFVFSNMLSKQRKSPLVRCLVCQDLRVSEKYRRHLRWHVNAGDVHADKIEEVILKSKFTRKDSLQKSGISFGFRCTVSMGEVICGLYVKSKQRHLIKTHKLLSNNEAFSSLVLEGCSHVTQSFNDAPQQISSNFLRSRSKCLSPLKMNDFSIQLTYFDIVKPSTEVTKPISKHKLACVKLDMHSMSTNLAEENLFLETFYLLIIDEANCRTITEQQVRIQSELIPKFNGSLTAFTLKFRLTIYKLLHENCEDYWLQY